MINAILAIIENPVVASLLGVFIGGIVTYGFGIRLARRQEFNKAATAFRTSFFEEIRFIDRFYAVDRAGKDIPDILADAADKHEKALILFKDGFLSKDQRSKIERVWKEYTGEDKHMGKYTFKQYATIGKFKNAEDIRKLVLKRIEKLLKFANPK